MAGKDFTALKKKRELDIVRMIYREDHNPIKEDHAENPDFLLFNVFKKYVFGVEITELYRNESSARLKKIAGYVDELVEHGKYRHKDDIGELTVDEIEILDEAGNTTSAFKGVMQKLPDLAEFVGILESYIREKEEKLAHYSTEARFHNLLIYDTEDYFASLKIEDLYGSIFNGSVQQAIQYSRFREIYLIGKINDEMRYIPLKAYCLYAYAHQFEGFYNATIGTPISVAEHILMFIGVLSKTGLSTASVHRTDTFIAVSYGDLSIRIDLVDHPAASCFLFNRDIDYSDGQPVDAFAAGLSIGSDIASQFERHQAEHTFHSSFSFVVEPKKAGERPNLDGKED